MKQHLLTLFLALAASVGTLFAQSGTCGDNLKWTLSGGTLTISGTGAMTNYTYSGGKSNTPWYSYSSSIKTVIIEDGVTSIGNYAFYKCTGLTSVTIPNSVTSIGYEALSGCSGLPIIDGIRYADTYLIEAVDKTLSTYTIKEGTRWIGGSAFQYCSKLTSITIPSSVTTIGSHAFSACSSLTSITIPNSVTSIGDVAFSSCSSLTSITIPNSVINFGKEPFMGCYSLPVIDNIRYADTYLVAAVDKTLSTYTIKEGTRWIGGSAFQYCSKLTSITIPNSVTSIGNKAFHGCISLTSVTIPNSVTSIGYSAFEACSGLTSVTIPTSVTSIGDDAFHGCYSLTSIIIPNSVTSIGNKAFYGCSGLTSVVWNAKNCQDFTSAPFDNQITSFTFGPEVEHIPAYLCSNLSNVNNIVLPCSVKSIGENAFHSSTVISRDCGIRTSDTYLTLCEGENVKWNNTNIVRVKPSDNGDYTYETKTVLYDDSIATLHLSVIPTSYTTLRDTVLCYEDGLTLDGIKCTLQKSTTQKQLWSYTLKSIDGCDSVINIYVQWKKPEMQRPDTILCYDDDLVLDGIKCSLTKKANVKQLWSYTLQTPEGCDSTVTINVTWRKLPDFTITTRHEYDTYNSGSISYQKANANYSDKYYYTLNGEKGRSLSNLPAGTYRLVFYSEKCDDSVEKTVQIYRYGMKVNNQYYLLDDENHTATLTYRGASYSDYSNEYSGNITIPESITFNGQEYKVTGIGASAFSGCSVTSVTMTSKQPITISNSSGLGSAIVYVPFGSLSDYKKTSYWYNYNLHVINPSHSSSSSSATSVSITLGNSEEAKHIASCGMEGGEGFAGNVIEYIGLEPESEYADVPFFVKTKEGDYDNLKATFKTTALTLTTLASKAVSNSTSILLAETNMSDSETSCGFEWRRNDQPADMPSNQVLCPVANGLMAGRLKGLKDDVYYKYRAFYKSAAGNMFYGDWQYVFTGDVTVEFDPVLYTYAAQFVSERKATLKGYALAGSDDFTEQGFEYWAESRRTDVPARRSPQYAIGEKHTVTGTGISMRVTLEDLDEGTVYKYRTYAKVGDKTLYGAEMTFITQGTYEDPIETDLDLIPDADADSLTLSPHTPQARKYIRNGILYIEHNGITYTAQGHRID